MKNDPRPQQSPHKEDATSSLSRPQRNLLMTLAWQSVAHGLKTGKPLIVDLASYPVIFSEHHATFVTLNYLNQPRGCFGNLRAVRPLGEDICENAFAAAFFDRHYPSVTDMEIGDLSIQIDLLSALESLNFQSELDLTHQLRPYRDGLVLDEGSHHAFFMPSNWETFKMPMQFLQQLKRKAGLPAPYWSKTVKISRFTIETLA
ncbi:MAG: AmmeMemoRadiSam system protein A [Gammaproteobacteria bacterium]